MGIKEKREEKIKKLKDKIVLSDTSESDEEKPQTPIKQKKEKKIKKQKEIEIEQEENQDQEEVQKKSKKDKKKKKKASVQEIEEEEEEEEIIVKQKKQKKDKKNKKSKEIIEQSEVEEEQEKPKKQKKNKKQSKEIIENEQEEEVQEKIQKKVKLSEDQQQQQTQQQNQQQNQDGQVNELILQGLSFESSKEDIENWLNSLNPENKTVQNVKLLWDNHNNRSRGTAFVIVDSQNSLLEIIAKLHNTEFMGRKVRIQNAGQRQQKEDGINHEAVPYGTKTILVRNLSFKATEEDIKKVFSESGEVEKVRLQTLNGKSRGYCYVDFTSSDGSNTAVEKQNNVEIKGRSVKVCLGHPEKTEEQIKAKKIKYLGFTYDDDYKEKKEKENNNNKKQNISDTIFVGNMDFEVEESDIKSFFEEKYGEVSEVRLAKYEDGSLKGFGFVKFSEAENTLKAIENNGIEFRNRELIIQSSSSKGKK